MLREMPSFILNHLFFHFKIVSQNQIFLKNLTKKELTNY